YGHLAGQTSFAVTGVGAEGLPAIDRRASKRVEEVITEGLVALGSIDEVGADVLDGFGVGRIEHVGDGVRTEGWLAGALASAGVPNEVAKCSLLQELLEHVEARDSQHRCMQQRVDDCEGGDLGLSALITDVLEGLWHTVDADGVLLELVEPLLLFDAFFEVVEKAQLPRAQFGR